MDAIRKYTEVRLDLDSHDLVRDIWELGGWYEGRKVDISQVEKAYEGTPWVLNQTAQAFFTEFYGIADEFCFKYRHTDAGKGSAQSVWSIGGNDLFFDIDEILYTVHATAEEDQITPDEQALIAQHDVNAVPVVESGYHLPGVLWASKSGSFLRTYYWSSEIVETYPSVYDLFAHDLEQFCHASELWVSIGGYAKEWGVGGDYYLRRYEEEYGA